MIKTWAALDDNLIVFDIVQFSITDPAPYSDAEYIFVGEGSPIPTPSIGDIWDAENNVFIKP